MDSLPFRSVFELISALVVCDFGGFSADFTGGFGLSLGLTFGTTASDFLEFQGPIKMTRFSSLI